MKMLARLIALFGLLIAAPALAETIIVAEGDEMTGSAATTYSGAYDAAHADFYINSGTGWGVANLETNIAATTSRTPAWVTIFVSQDLSGAASTAAWFSALTTHIANLRAAVSGVKIAVMTLPPKTGDATYTSRRPVANGLIRAAEGVEIDRVIDFAAHPIMGPDSAAVDANLFSSNLAVDCTTVCSLSTPASSYCYADVTMGGAKGQDYYNKQYRCAMESILAGQYPWTVYERPVVYSTSAVVPTTDPPAYTLAQPDDIPTSASTTGWTTADAATYCGGASGCVPLWTSGAFMEKKFRTTMNGTWTGRFDPVRGPFQTVWGHAHTGFGVNNVTGSSTYKTLRTDQSVGNSWAAGGLLNSTAYWVPGILQADAVGDGVTRMKKIRYVIVYYNSSWAGDTTPVAWDHPRGMSYVFGTDMDDPLDVKVKAEIAAYSTKVSYIGNGWIGWNCEGTAFTGRKGLTNADGTDALGACAAAHDIYAELNGPECWDGWNLRSANGYYHVRRAVTNSSTTKPVCPDSWYPIAQVQEKIFYSHLSTTDYITWTCDSDAAFVALGGANRKCASFHGDWFGAWDYPTMQTWMHFCTGSKSTSTDSFTPHQCDSSAIDATNRLLDTGAAPAGGRNPQVNLSLDVNGSTASEWWDVPALTASPTGQGHKGRLRLHKKN